jgi:hypothetical protein
VIQARSEVAHNVSDTQAPVVAHRRKAVDVKGVLACLLVDLTPDALRVRLLEGLNLAGERFVVCPGPLELPPWIFK